MTSFILYLFLYIYDIHNCIVGSEYIYVCKSQLSRHYFLPRGKHGSKRRERGSIFLQGFQLIPQFHHGLGYHGFFVLILALEIGQSNFTCLSVGQRSKRIRGGGRHQELFSDRNPKTRRGRRIPVDTNCSGCSGCMWFMDFCVFEHEEKHTHSLMGQQSNCKHRLTHIFSHHDHTLWTAGIGGRRSPPAFSHLQHICCHS